MSLLNSFSGLIGFTEAEVRENFMDVIKVYCDEEYVETELNNLKSHYNGYKFCISDQEKRVFSPVSVIKHLKSSLDIFEEKKEKKNEKNKGIFYYFHKF